VTALLAGGIGGVIGDRLNFGDSGVLGGVVDLYQANADTSSRPDGSIAQIAAAVTPGVVSISVTTSAGSGTGSGLIIDASGYIITNNHVVSDATSGGEILVDLTDGRSFEATIVGRNSAYDLAVLKIDATDLPALTLGNSDGLVVGDTVVAVGAPLGLQGTVTTGIISALDRPVTAGGTDDMSYINAIQTDAAINPGNSGGPLINAQGQVIGVNSAIAVLNNSSTQSGSIGLGFAIPINAAKRIAEEIMATGSSSVPIVGVQLDMRSTARGAYLAEVDANGPAAKAGLKAGTLVTKVDGRTVRTPVEFVVTIRDRKPGDTVTLTIESGETFKVVLGAKTTDS
jgi:putative serine protease PepD